MVAVDVGYYHAVAGFIEAEIYGGAQGLGRVFEVYGYHAAEGAGELIESSAGFAEKFIFRAVGAQGYFHRGHGVLVIQLVEYAYYKHLVGGGGRKPGAAAHVAHGAGVEAADLAAVGF